jgi:hypothetical protein
LDGSFTHSSDSLEALRGSKWVLVVHFHEAADAVRRIIEATGAPQVYESVETSPITLTKRAHLAGTNPLMFKRTAMFRFEDDGSCEATMQRGVLDELERAAAPLSVQLYRRVPRKDTLPAPLARILSALS